MKETNVVLTEKHFFDYLGGSKQKTFSAIADIKILLQESKKKLSKGIVLYNCWAFDWHFDGRNRTGTYAEFQVWKFRQVSIKISFWNSGTNMILIQGTQPTTIYSTDLSPLHRNWQKSL